MIYGLAQAYSSLPERGAVMDQPVWVLRMHCVLQQAGHFGDVPGSGAPAPENPLAGLEMVTF